MQIDFLIDNSTVELLSNTDTGENVLTVNGEIIPTSSWTGSGYYTVDGISIKKIADNSGNIFCNKISDTEYELVKAVSNPIYASSVIFDNANTDLSAGDVQEAIEELDEPTFTEASTRANVVSGEGTSTLWGKVKKFFSDLKAVAFSGSYTDLTTRPLGLEPTATRYLSDLNDISGFSDGHAYINQFSSTASNIPSDSSGTVITYRSSETYVSQFAFGVWGNKVACRIKGSSGWGGWYFVPTAYTSNPVMDGTASAGSSANLSRGDHRHPTDTSRAASSTVSSLSTTVSNLVKKVSANTTFNYQTSGSWKNTGINVTNPDGYWSVVRVYVNGDCTGIAVNNTNDDTTIGNAWVQESKCRTFTSLMTGSNAKYYAKIKRGTTGSVNVYMNALCIKVPS